jgi:membrane protein DedA with SNARE-associated domain
LLHITPLYIVLGLLAGGIGLPVPEDLVLLAAGWRVSRGGIGFWQMAPIALASIVASDLMLYGFGRIARNHPRAARWLERPSVARLADAYRRRGVRLVLLARVAMGMRAPFFLAAGLAKMPLGRFVLVDALGGGIMTLLWINAGAWLGPRLDRVAPHLHAAGYAATAAVIALVAWKARRLLITNAPAAPLEQPSSTDARLPAQASATQDPRPSA